MRIAVVGATGRIGAQLTRSLLEAGHQVRALSRGGPALDALAKMGAEPFIGSFDTGVGELNVFFAGVDAAFLMVKTDWNNIHDHYPTVAQRFVDALSHSSVKLAVSLSALGAEKNAKSGHSAGFHKLEEKLNELSDISLVHLRAAWFMENTAIWTQSVAKYNRIAWSMRPDLKMPWVATDDIARLAAEELTHSIGAHRVIREVGSEEFTMNELASLIAKEIGHAVEYRQIEKNEHDRSEFIERFGTEDRWRDDQQTAEEYNNGAMRFHGSGAPLRPELPTKMADFLKVFWMPRYLRSTPDDSVPQTYFTWTARN